MQFHQKYFLIVTCVLALPISAQKKNTLKPTGHISLMIPEPSDICFNAKSNTYYVVSDNGILFETDRNGKIVRSTKEKNCDYEAIFADENFIYAVDETHRNIHIYDPITFKTIRIVNVPYSGGRNKGYEAITFNKSKNKFLLITERDPITLFELDSDFKVTNQIDLSAISRDISSACYHNDKLWLLGDEDRTLYQLNPQTYEVIQKWVLPVINPEGLAFDAEGNLLISCDDIQRLYYFNNPEKL